MKVIYNIYRGSRRRNRIFSNPFFCCKKWCFCVTIGVMSSNLKFEKKRSWSPYSRGLTGLDLTPAIAGPKNMSPFQNTITSPKLPPKTKTKYEILGKYPVLEVWLLSFTIDIIYHLHIWGVYIPNIHPSVRQPPTFLPKVLNSTG